MADDNKRPIIIKKIKKVSGGGHHGGSWKVAYADFVTAMMAFFLLMWLLNMTTIEQKKGIASYFAPIGVTNDVVGTMGVMNKGTAIKEAGDLQSLSLEQNISTNLGPNENEEESGGKSNNDGRQDVDDPKAQEQKKNLALEEAIKKAQEKEQKDLKETEEKIKKMIAESPEIKKFTDNIKVHVTDEGLQIQIVDQGNQSMFPIGSSAMYPHMRMILEKITSTIIQLPNKISITGHTDSAAYREGAQYDNWNLSADRAQSCRRVMTNAGYPKEKIYAVIGKEDNELLIPSQPYSPMNRRISILLLRRTGSAVPGNKQHTTATATQAVPAPPKPSTKDTAVPTKSPPPTSKKP